MSEKISILKQIMELLADKEMTSVELAPLLLNKDGEKGIKVSNCSYKLNVLYEDGRIIRTTNKRPYKYKVAMTPIELLKELYNIMINKMSLKTKLTSEEDEIMCEIEEVLKIE